MDDPQFRYRFGIELHWLTWRRFFVGIAVETWGPSIGVFLGPVYIEAGWLLRHMACTTTTVKPNQEPKP